MKYYLAPLFAQNGLLFAVIYILKTLCYESGMKLEYFFAMMS